ncbi:MAG TPA: DUF559 domain-containing protein [Actinomycetota bacterium]|nr:DUF559 domain-containing protein [Actinomycetota bacterium]
MSELGARAALKRLVEDRARGVTESSLETRALRSLLRAGLPRPVMQYRIGRYRVDFAYPAARVAIECDGYRYHSSRQRFDADRARDLALTREGWRVLRVTWFDVEQLVETLRALL